VKKSQTKHYSQWSFHRTFCLIALESSFTSGLEQTSRRKYAEEWRNQIVADTVEELKLRARAVLPLNSSTNIK
jgi:hypothetical protein